jgi:hypothetical protein
MPNTYVALRTETVTGSPATSVSLVFQAFQVIPIWCW